MRKTDDGKQLAPPFPPLVRHLSHNSNCANFLSLHLCSLRRPPLAHPFMGSHLTPTPLLEERGGKRGRRRRRHRWLGSARANSLRREFSNATLYLTSGRLFYTIQKTSPLKTIEIEQRGKAGLFWHKTPSKTPFLISCFCVSVSSI